MEKENLTVPQVAKILNVTDYTVRRYINEGKLIATKETFKGSSIRYFISIANLNKFKDSMK